MTRTIHKQLATAEDMALGDGLVSQQRGQQIFQLHKLAIAVGLATEDQLAGLDPVQFPRAKYGTKEFLSEDGINYQEMLALTPYQYRTGYVLTEANPYLYAEGYILKRITNLPYTLIGDVAADKLSPVDTDDWEIVIFSGGASYNYLDPLTFTTGATLDNEMDALLWPVESGGNGWYYKWTGAFDKVVPPNSTPETTGGVGAGKWLAVNVFQSFVQENKPTGIIPVGSRWYKPSTSKTYVYSAIGLEKHWIQEFVATNLVVNLEAPIWLEDFAVNAGTGGDDTPAMIAACAHSMATGRGIMYRAGKTYRLRSKQTSETPYMLKGYLKGMPGSRVEAYDTPAPDGTNQWRILLPITAADIEVCGFELDGKISADPVNWATGYDSFLGSRGLVFINCFTTHVHNVKTYNTMWAGIAHYNCENSTIDQNYVQRCRGNFGDAYYMWGRNFVYTGNKGYDFTRIGYVAETNAGSVELTRNGKYLNNEAEYGHDASGLYGGVEGNTGYWFENYINVDIENGVVKNCLEGGFKTVPSYITSAQPSVAKVRRVSSYLRNCWCYNTRYGVIVDNIQEGLQNRTVVEGGGAIDVNIGAYVGIQVGYTPRNQLEISGWQVRISVHNSASKAIMALAGRVKIRDSEIIFDDGFNQTLWDDDVISGYSTFGSFDTFAPESFEVINVECYKEIAGVKTEIGVRTKFNSAGTRDNMQMLRFVETKTSQIANLAREIQYISCKPLLWGTDIPTVRGLVYDCTLTKRRLFGSTQVSAVESLCEDFLFERTVFAFDAPDEYLYLYNNSRAKSSPMYRLIDCTLRRNFAANGYGIRINGETAFIGSVNDVYNVYVQNMTIENTGGATTNAIVHSDLIPANNAVIYGTGNYKSANLANDVSGNITSYF